MKSNEMETLDDSLIFDDLDVKMAKAFPGRVVRKDLVKNLKIGFTIPVYVLEYLLGKYCSGTDPEQIRSGLETVKKAIAEKIVRGDETELIKTKLQMTGSIRIIDLVTVRLDEKVAGGKFWAKLATSGIDNVHIDPTLVYTHERLLTGGVWSNIELIWDEEGGSRPFVISKLSPIQIASADMMEFIEARQKFTRDEWINILLRTMGYNSEHTDFTFRRKLLFLLRMIPMVETNYNMIELGPRGTGKSYVYREISPYVILLSGGQGTVPDLFGWKNRKDKPGLVLKYDLVAFDEVAGSNFKKDTDKQMYKGYMEQGSFSRGDDKGTISAEAGIVFNGNIDGDIETTARISHLFNCLPESVRNDMAFHDRWHSYLPGWEIPKMQTDYFTNHLGFISDFISEIFHSGLRKRNYTNNYDKYFALGNHLEERDRKAIARTVSGFIKLLHPDGDCSRDDMEDYISIALELRRRVKEQLKKMGGIEYAKVNFSYIDKETGQENFIGCPELGTSSYITERSTGPGDLYTIGFDSNEKRYSLYQIQVTATQGKSRFNIVGTKGKGIKESSRMAYDFLRANVYKIGIDKDVSDHDINIQVISLMQGKDADDLGVAFYLGLISALIKKPVATQLVILGHMTLHGALTRVEGLGDKLRIAMDSGAKKVLIPTENKRDFATLPTEVIDKLEIIFYSDPTQAVMKAFAD